MMVGCLALSVKSLFDALILMYRGSGLLSAGSAGNVGNGADRKAAMTYQESSLQNLRSCETYIFYQLSNIYKAKVEIGDEKKWL
jgi:hypothetical protein